MCVHSNIKHTYRIVPLAHLGLSDHLSLVLIPAYTPLKMSAKVVTNTIKILPEMSLPELQGYYESTIWDY